MVEWVVMLKNDKALTVNMTDDEAVQEVLWMKEVNDRCLDTTATLEHTLKRLRYALLNIINKNINDVVLTENDIEQEIPLDKDIILSICKAFMDSIGGDNT